MVAGARAPATLALLSVAMLAFACRRPDAGATVDVSATEAVRPAAAALERSATGATASPAVRIDSILPIEEELRRFREGVPEVTVLGSGAATSRDALVHRFVDALARQDTALLAVMLIDRAEFAWLYYPHSLYSREPYELSPALVWFQMVQGSEKGIGRALRRFGGERLVLRGYRCETGPVRQARNRIWTGCVLRFARRSDEFRLFGAIIERAGRFKFLSYGNAL